MRQGRREEVEEPMPPAPPPEAKPSWISDAPWWLISIGLHGVLILGAALVYVERAMALDEGEVTIIVSPRPTTVVTEIERPRDIFERKGIPKDDTGDPAPPTEEPAIFFPEAKESDHNESADGEDYHQMKGDSKEFLSYIKGEGGGIRGRQAGKNPGVYDTMGVGGGGGGGGRYGGRFGGRENLVARGGGTRATESAVLAALKWLARHQSPDGSWSADRFSEQCVGGACAGPGEKDFTTGLTGLSLLAFLGAGYSHLSRDEYPDSMSPGKVLKFGEVVKKSIQWLTSHQGSDGCLGEQSAQKYMYNHTIASLALCEAYGMTAAQILKEPAQKAVEFLLVAQNPGQGWRYSSKCGDNDSSVTGWAAMVLKSAELSEIPFPRSAYDGVRSWYDEVTEETYGRVGYNQKGTGKVYVPGMNEQFEHHEALTAIGIMARIFMDKRKNDPRLSNGCDLLLGDKPKWDGNYIDYYYWYYATLALFQYDGPEGPKWKGWNEGMKNALVPNQKTGKDACQNGSWDAVDRWSGEGGRVYGTAINALTLEVYYRYANVFGVSGGHNK